MFLDSFSGVGLMSRSLPHRQLALQTVRLRLADPGAPLWLRGVSVSLDVLDDGDLFALARCSGLPELIEVLLRVDQRERFLHPVLWAAAVRFVRASRGGRHG